MIAEDCYTATGAWLHVLKTIVDRGTAVAPRGMPTVECLHNSAAFSMLQPAVNSPARKLSWKFAAAEALWINAGDATVAGIAPWNKKIADFSDDGETFFGAYGPKFVDQLPYVAETLVRDRDSRQAVSSIWREKPPATKDVPCTLSLTFSIRDDRLDVHAFMRSSDAWLGLPYDFFNFAMLGLRTAAAVNALLGVKTGLDGAPFVRPGNVYWTAVSSHLYETNFAGAVAVLAESNRGFASRASTRIPDEPPNWFAIEAALFAARDANERPVFSPIPE